MHDADFGGHIKGFAMAKRRLRQGKKASPTGLELLNEKRLAAAHHIRPTNDGKEKTSGATSPNAPSK
ncbi:hypothetical protein V6N12_057981 [Hibiscus sabdariffa]|uniref:Uncharacterized protein n=1 Tax=Hibiscus sabdariffa TaxID=183260 RepID=A0ABR2AEB4_9ROSI